MASRVGMKCTCLVSISTTVNTDIMTARCGGQLHDKIHGDDFPRLAWNRKGLE